MADIELSNITQLSSRSQTLLVESASPPSFQNRLETSIKKAAEDAKAAKAASAENARSGDSLRLLDFLRRLKQMYPRVKQSHIYHGPPKKSNEVSKTPEPRTAWMINLWTFTSPDPVHDSHGHDLSSKIAVSEWRSRFEENLMKTMPQSLQVVSLAESISPDDVNGLYSFWEYTRATCGGKLGILPYIPLWMCQFLISQLWSLDLMPRTPNSAPDGPLGLPRHRPEFPPSMRRKQSQSTRGANEIHLTWQHQPTVFTSDLAAYIWEYHKSIPASESCKIVLLESPGKPVRLHLSFRSCRAQSEFAVKLTDRKTPNETNMRISVSGDDWSPMNEAFLSILCALEIMTEETAEFLTSCSEELSRLSALSRRYPSTSKTRFLLHLDDCRQAGLHGVKSGLDAIKTVSSWIHTYQLPSTEVQHELGRLRTDLKYLHSQLSALETTVRKDKEVLRQHFQLTQEQTLFRLTLLAAIFLPLSFATSFFGMNIDGIPEDVATFFGPNSANLSKEDKDNSEFLRAMDSITDENTRSATAALAAALGSQDATWKTFAIAAVCLLCTLPVALTAGAVIRGIIVIAAKYVIYWRGLAILGIFIACLLTVYPWSYISWFVFVAAFLLWELWQTYQAWNRMQQPFFWTFLLLFTGACLFLQLAVLPFAMGVPWLVLGLWYTISRWKRRRRQA